MLHRTATPNVGIYVATVVHHCVIECCAMTTKSVSMSSEKYWFNQPFNPTFEGKNYWVLEIQDGPAAGAIIPSIGYWLSVIHTGV